jgi:hypothetical protein
MSSTNFRDKDHAGLHHLFRDNTREINDRIASLDAEILEIPDDYYSALSDAVEAAGDRHYIKLSPRHTLYLFEYCKISKVGGANSPYAYMQ